MERLWTSPMPLEGDVRRLVRVYRGYKCDWDVMHVVVHDVETVSRDVHYWIISEDIQREAPSLRDAALCDICNKRVVFGFHRF